MNIQFHVEREEPSEHRSGGILVYAFTNERHYRTANRMRVLVPDTQIQANPPVEVVRWLAGQFESGLHFRGSYIFLELCKDQTIRRAFHLRDLVDLRIEQNRHLDRYDILARLSDGQGFGMSISRTSVAHEPPEYVNLRIAQDLTWQTGVDPVRFADTLNRLVINSHNRVGWEYATGRPVHPRWFDSGEQIDFGNFATSLNYVSESATLSVDALILMQERLANLSWGNSNSSPDPKRKEADERAKELLVSHLTDDQKKTFEQGYFECVGNKTGRTYRINNFRNINASCVEDGRTVKYCVVQSESVPLCDQLLTEKMLIENDEDRFLKVANKFEGGRTVSNTVDVSFVNVTESEMRAQRIRHRWGV